MIIGYSALILMVVFTTASQVMIKSGALKIQPTPNLKLFLRSCFNKHIIVGGGLVLLATLAYIFSLTRLPLNTAYSFTGLNYILVFLASWRIVKEKVNGLQFIGVIFIFIGILIWNI